MTMAGKEGIARRRLLLLALVGGFMLAGLASARSASAAGVWWHLSVAPASSDLAPGTEGELVLSVGNVGYKEAGVSPEKPLKVLDRVPAGLEVIEHNKLTKENELAGYENRLEKQGRFNTTEFKCERSVTKEADGSDLVTCEATRSIPPYEGMEVVIPVKVAANETLEHLPPLVNEARVEGGEELPASEWRKQTVHIATGPTPFGVEHEGYELKPENEDGTVDTQAGSHPFQLTTTFNLNQTLESNHDSGRLESAAPALLNTVHFVLPRGLLGNVNVVPQCPKQDFLTITEGDFNLCPPNTAIGVARVTLNEPNIFHGVLTEAIPIFNIEPEKGEPASFGFELAKVSIVLKTAVRTGSDYAVEVTAEDSSTAAGVLSTQVTFWGTPGDERHNLARGWPCIAGGRHSEAVKESCNEHFKTSLTPFLTMPTLCESEPTTTVTGTSWPHGPGKEKEVSKLEATYPLAAFTGCGSLPFSPKLEEVTPEEHSANTPTGMKVKINVPQESTLSASELAEADVKATKINLPSELLTSPGAANGLSTCEAGQFGFTGQVHGEPSGESGQLENESFTSGAPGCPIEEVNGQKKEPDKIGTVTINSPLLKPEDQPVGGVYLAHQNTNPFSSPLVLYLFAESPISHVRVKLAGEVQISESGQLTSVFRNTPAVPFNELTVNLFGGGRASQSTPAHCGSYPTEAAFTPWSGGSEAKSSASFSITSGPNGEGCPGGSLPFSPSVKAGPAEVTQAGAFSPFTLTIEHPDGDQPLTGMTVHLPPGVAAMLSSVTPCQFEKAQKNECGEESEIGEASSVSGLGGEPITLKGKAYLTTGFDGAPFGLSASTPAKAGPFNLGNVIVNATIEVDPNTAAVTTVVRESIVLKAKGGTQSESSLPTMIEGVPAQLKEIHVQINKEVKGKGFEFNPTNCAPKSVFGTPMETKVALSGKEGGSEEASQSYGVSGCAALPFTPTLAASTEGSFSKANGASFVVTVSSGPGQANIAKTKLVIPAELPSRLTTIQKACPDATFEKNPALCDEGSNIGMGTAVTPVLKTPLTGPAYLVSHGGAAFPDVEFVLQGEGIKLILDGKTNIHNNVTTSFFEMLPDAPVTSFVADLPKGPHSALGAYPGGGATTLCGRNIVIPTTLWGQNGAVIQQQTKVVVTGCHGVKSFKLTRAQLLAKALKACRTKYKHSKAKRQKCERQARRRYGAHASKAKAHAKKSTHAKKRK